MAKDNTFALEGFSELERKSEMETITHKIISSVGLPLLSPIFYLFKREHEREHAQKERKREKQTADLRTLRSCPELKADT